MRGRFRSLCRVFSALKDDKDKQLATWNNEDYFTLEDWADVEEADNTPSVFRPESEWRAMFDERAMARFKAWPSPEAHDAYMTDWETRPVRENVHSDPRHEPPWDFTVMLRMFEEGERAFRNPAFRG